MSDADLALAWQTGVAGADAEAFRRFSPRLQRYVTRRISARADAADVVQDTFIRASMRIQQLRDPARFGAWLYAIAGNRVHDVNARREIPRDIDEAMLPACVDPVADDAVIHAHQRDRVRLAASLLNARDQQVIDMYVWRGCDSQTIADTLSLELAHAYVVVGRARTRLGRAIRLLDLVESESGACAQLDAIRRSGASLRTLTRRVGRHVESCPDCALQCSPAHDRGNGLLAAQIPRVGAG